MRRDTLVKKIIKLFPKRLQKRLPSTVAVIGLSEGEARAFNRRYRCKNKAANVLSFNYGSDYGEIFLCPAVIRQEAKKQGNSYEYQMTWMLIHGILHLAGIHHERSPKDESKFERIEANILRKWCLEKTTS